MGNKGDKENKSEIFSLPESIAKIITQYKKIDNLIEKVLEENTLDYSKKNIKKNF